MNKRYLGDGVYIEIEYGLGLVLTTSNGMEDTNRIVLETHVIMSLQDYLKELENESQRIFDSRSR